jgi:predicted permease
MTHWARVRSFAAALFRRGRIEREMADEWTFHLDARTDALMATGMGRAEAIRQARREFGDPRRWREEGREALGLRLLQDFTADLRHALRQMRRAPTFTIIAIVTLALGIGANTAIFTLLDAVVFKPLAVPAVEQLVALREEGSEGTADVTGGTGRYFRFSYPRFQRLSDALGTSGTLAAVTRSSPFVLRQVDGSSIARVNGQLVSGAYFATLDVLATHGRLLGETDVRAAAPVAVVSDAFWRRRMNASASAIGQTLVLDDVSVTVVGIAEPGFVGIWTDSEAELWMPLTLQPVLGYQNNSSSWGGDINAPWPSEDRIAWLNVIGRIRPTERDTVTARLQTINHRAILDATAGLDPRDSMRSHALVVEPLDRGFSGLRGRYQDALVALAALVALVLLVTCSSVANLLLVRAAGQAREMGVRTALGATIGRLVRQGIAESALLALGGGLLGLCAGTWASQLLARQVIASDEGTAILPHVFALDGRVLIFTAAVALGTVLLFGLAPAIRATRLGRAAAPGSQQRGVIDRSAMMGMRPLVVLQVSLSVVVAVAAVLLSRTLMNVVQVAPGFSDRLVAADLDPAASGYSAAQARALDARLATVLAAVPSVTDVAVSRCGLIAGCSSSGSYVFEGLGGTGAVSSTYLRNWIGPGYFQSVGIPLLAGREFGSQDATGPSVAIVSESIARRFFPGQNPIGRRMGAARLDTEIVGVVRDARSLTIHKPPVPMVYLPLHAASDTGMRGYYLEARVTGSPEVSVGPIREAVRAAEPGLLIDDVTTIRARLARDTGRERLVAYLALGFAGLTLGLASLGIYGVLAYDVTRRTKEIGLRMALGARRTDVIARVVKDGLGLTVIGLPIGLVGAVASAQYIQGMLVGVSPLSVLSLALVSLVFVAVALAASFWPARRAMGVDPLAALRGD